MANLLEGIGQAYAQDYRNVRKEREEAEKDALKRRLMYMAFSPIGETFAASYSGVLDNATGLFNPLIKLETNL